MLNNMMRIMKRIDSLQKRFGLKRHNPIPETEKRSSVFDNKIKESQNKIDALQSQNKVQETPKGDLTPKAFINSLADKYGSQFGVSPSLVKAVINVESGYNPKAVSPKGAKGLMQLMPSAALDVKVKDPFSPEENVRGGTELLGGHLKTYDGDYKKALAAYNAGRGAVDKYNGVPKFPETQNYVKNVIEQYLKNR